MTSKADKKEKLYLESSLYQDLPEWKIKFIFKILDPKNDFKIQTMQGVTWKIILKWLFWEVLLPVFLIGVTILQLVIILELYFQNKVGQ